MDGRMNSTPEGVSRGAPVQALVRLRVVRNGGHRLDALHGNTLQLSLLNCVSVQRKEATLQCTVLASQLGTVWIWHGCPQMLNLAFGVSC